MKRLDPKSIDESVILAKAKLIKGLSAASAVIIGLGGTAGFVPLFPKKVQPAINTGCLLVAAGCFAFNIKNADKIRSERLNPCGLPVLYGKGDRPTAQEANVLLSVPQNKVDTIQARQTEDSSRLSLDNPISSNDNA